MRLWFGSRSDLLVSEPFDVVRDQHALVQFFLSVMFAPLCLLGYDPTIMRSVLTGDNEDRLYDITVRRIDEDDKARYHVYRTTYVVANFATQNMRSRGTRVWRAREVLGAGKSGKLDNLDILGQWVVVKNYWIDDDRMPESKTLARILEAAKASGDPEDEALFNQHFFHVVCHGYVYVEGDNDHIFTLMRKVDGKG
ncbi:hypothetical protein BDW22DRAFT_1362530 [Trametopsis cervina]|nr:hypothetical protein BDW22DRAFT_1362530 [Trametopsis cervina]